VFFAQAQRSGFAPPPSQCTPLQPPGRRKGALSHYIILR
jgi:hypothetical protein